MGCRAGRITGSFICASALLLLSPAPARADASDKAVAEALFQKGREAMDRADYPTACAALEESNRLDPAPGTMANLADCEEKRGRLSSAWQWYQQVAARLPEEDPRRQLAAERAADLKSRVPLLTIRLAPGAPPDTKVVRGGVEIRGVSLGLPLPIDPGDQQIVVSAPGRPERRYLVTLAEKEQLEVVVEPGVAGQAPSAGPAQAPAAAVTADAGSASGGGGSSKKTLGYVLGGVGVAGIGTALVFGGLALGKKSTVADHCDEKSRTCDSDDAVDAASSGQTLTTLSNVSFVIGVAAAGAGAYFILTSKDEPPTAVGATAVPGGAAVQVSGVF